MTILYFPEQIPVSVECVLVEEAKAVQTNLECPACRALLAQLEQVAAYFLFAELIG